MAKSQDATSPTYVNIAHRSSLLYSFAALLLAEFSAHSVLPEWMNIAAAVAALAFFAFAITTYMLSTACSRTQTTNCAARTASASAFFPAWVTGSFMVLLLIVAEVGGTLVLGTGAMMGIWHG